MCNSRHFRVELSWQGLDIGLHCVETVSSAPSAGGCKIPACTPSRSEMSAAGFCLVARSSELYQLFYEQRQRYSEKPVPRYAAGFGLT